MTIADFSFTPGTITIHVGDAVLWVNEGPSAHTATANNGSFDTGLLNKGQNASVTFHLPGRFDYHCSIHPFMHGAVVVLANSKTSSSSGSSSRGSSSSGSSGGSGNSGGGGGGGTRSGAASSAGGTTGASGGAGTRASSGEGTLPLTGVNVVAVVVVGLALSGAGLLLNRLRRRGLS